MRPHAHPARRPRVLDLFALLVVVLLAASCDSGAAPTAPPSPSGSLPTVAPPATAAVPSPAGHSTGPSLPPGSQPVPQPSATPTSGAIVPGALAVTVSDRLRVRSQPRVAQDSLLRTPLLPIGTQLLVLDGPVDASGYTWIRVSPVDLSLDDGIGDGWVAIADHDGTPWVRAQAAPLAGLSVAEAAVSRAPDDRAAAKTAAAGVNAFGLDLYRRIIADPDLALAGKGVAVSPTSIELALAMARAGANGPTAAQIDAVLRTSGWRDLGTGLGSLARELDAHNATWSDVEGTSHSLSLSVVNRAFGQDGWAIGHPYLERIGRAFGAGLALVDYADDASAARDTINAWVARQTANRIPTLLGPLDVTAATRLVLVNAIYMKANWAREFDPDQTRDRAFHGAGGKTLSVPTMTLTGERDVPLATGPGWQATRLAYLGADGSTPLTMTLIRPDNLAAFERSLTTSKLATVEAAIRAESRRQAETRGIDYGDMSCPTYAYNVRLFLPKFGVDTRVQLVPTLRAMGMGAALDQRADFSGITHDPLSIGTVIHQANIDVDETGTEAAAATAIGMDTTGGCGPAQPRTTKTLRFDQPFLYLVQDARTGAILFMGRVMDPTTR